MCYYIFKRGNIKETEFMLRAEGDEVFPGEVHATVLEM